MTIDIFACKHSLNLCLYQIVELSIWLQLIEKASTKQMSSKNMRQNYDQQQTLRITEMKEIEAEFGDQSIKTQTIDKYNLVIYILLALILLSFVPNFLITEKSALEKQLSTPSQNSDKINAQNKNQNLYSDESSIDKNIDRIDQIPQKKQEDINRAVQTQNIDEIVRKKVEEILAERKKANFLDEDQKEEPFYIPEVKKKENAKEPLMKFLGECIGSEICSEKKQISSADYNTLKQIGVPFYSLKKYEDPLNPPPPPEYFNISLVPQYKELPFCVIVINQKSQSSEKFMEIKDSIKRQGYRNVKMFIDNRYLSRQDVSAKGLKQMSAQICEEKSIVLLTENPLKIGALTKLNQIYQQRYTWLTYYQENYNFNEIKEPTHGIFSFYNLFLQNLPIRDAPLSSSKNFDDLYVAMIQMGYSHAYKVPYWDIFSSAQSVKDNIAFIHHSFNSQNYAKILYKSVVYLRSNYYLQKMEPLLINYIKVKKGVNSPEEGTHLTPFDIERNLQNIGLKDLPKQHLLYQRESNYLQSKYHLSEIKEQKTMCIVMLSYNNIEGNRYKYAIDTVFTQNYTNFHIVFIDDASTDETLSATKKRVKEMQYDETKIDYVRNEEQKYATYNIKNAGDNYCRSGEVIVLIDGDDQVVGLNALKILNLGYVRDDKWLVYSSYFSTALTYGGSKDPVPQFFTDEIRKRYYLIGPIRSFYVDLFRMIKESDHKDDEGNFLPNYYDGALQYPLFQMAGPQKIQYIPEISYLYTINYHGSDSKSQSHPRKIYQDQIYARPRYERVSEQAFWSAKHN